MKKNDSRPIMKFGDVCIFQLRDIETQKKMVRLTKWLPAVQKELHYLEAEYKRISHDPLRQAMLVYNNGAVALYVNDLTGGAFDRLSENEEDN